MRGAGCRGSLWICPNVLFIQGLARGFVVLFSLVSAPVVVVSSISFAHHVFFFFIIFIFFVFFFFFFFFIFIFFVFVLLLQVFLERLRPLQTFYRELMQRQSDQASSMPRVSKAVVEGAVRSDGGTAFRGPTPSEGGDWGSVAGDEGLLAEVCATFVLVTFQTRCVSLYMPFRYVDLPQEKQRATSSCRH